MTEFLKAWKRICLIFSSEAKLGKLAYFGSALNSEGWEIFSVPRQQKSFGGDKIKQILILHLRGFCF